MVAAPIAAHRLVKITAMVPTTARMGAGTRFSVKSAGTDDPTAAATSSEPRAGPPRPPSNRCPTAAAAIAEATSRQTSGPRRRSAGITRPPQPNHDRERTGRVATAVGVVTTSTPVERGNADAATAALERVGRASARKVKSATRPSPVVESRTRRPESVETS